MPLECGKNMVHDIVPSSESRSDPESSDRDAYEGKDKVTLPTVEL